MNKKLVLIVIIVLLVLAGIIYFRSQSDTKVSSNVNSLTTPSQIKNNSSSPAPTAEQADIQKDLNDIEKSLNESDSSLDSSDLNF